MSAPAILTNAHTADRWSVSPDGRTVTTAAGSPALEFGTDTELAALVAAAPKMARALKAVLNLDLGTEAERALRAEISDCLR